MSPFAEPLFPSRNERPYDAASVETFPWPVVAGYEAVHHWMDENQAVHAAWQLKDVWEGLLKFLGTLAVADHIANAPAQDPRTKKLLDQLLKKGGLTDGDWAKLLELALKERPLPGAGLPQLSPLLFKGGKPERLYRLFKDDTDDSSPDDFLKWRNLRFGHGVFGTDLRQFAKDARKWLGRLHEAFDLCRPLLQSLTLESDGPNGEILTWGEKSPLPFYHDHQPAAAGPPLPPVRVRTPGSAPLPLTPLLSVQRCLTCGNWTAFYLDKYDPDKHRAQFLDFIEGHTNDHKDLEPLRTWTAQLKAAKAPATAPQKPDPDEPREPDPERFRDFQHEFEPPVYLARQVADFLRTHDRGVLALTGPGGVGKSWATQGLDHAGMLPAQLGRAIPVLTVSMHGPTPPRASEVRTALNEFARREKRWQVPAWPEGPDLHTRFASWLAALMRANGLGELLVALDGLDDLPADSDVPDLWPPAGTLPPGCYLVLSNRPAVRAAAENGLRRVRSMPDHFGELRVGPEQPEHRAVLRSYVAKRLARPRPDGQGPLPAAWAEPLIDQAGGSFLFVFHYCRALHFGVYTDLTQLPPPATYYPAFFDHLRRRVGDDLFHGQYARTLAFLAVAREPVGLTHLEAGGLKRSSLIDILVDLADLLRTRREPWDAETLYSLGHDTIREFLTQDTYWQSRLAGANRDLAKQAVRRFGKDWSAVDPFDPVERYLLFRLLDHATEPELRQRLVGDTALAVACQKHGNTLWYKKEFAPCLVAYDIAVRLREDQVQQQSRIELRNELAGDYMNRGNALSFLERLEEALSDYNAAADLYEALAYGEARRKFRINLARVYTNRGRTLGKLGRLMEALADYSTSIRLYGELVYSEARGDLRDELAQAYINRGAALVHLGRLEEALADYNSCIGLCMEEQGEGRSELRHLLADAYNNRGDALRHHGRLEEALADFGTCTGLHEAMVQREGRREFRSDLALAYNNRGVTLADLGRLEEALADGCTCITLYEELVHHEGRRELRNDLARAYSNRARTLGGLGRIKDALADYAISIAVREDLVKRDSLRELRDQLAGDYMGRGCELWKLGRFQEALADYDLCIALEEELVYCEGRGDLRNYLAIAYMNRGLALASLGRLEEALADYGECIDLEEELVHREGRGELAGQLAWGYADQAVVLLRMGRREEACRRARAAVAILQSEVSRTRRADLRSVLERAEQVGRDACG